ncbi:basic salivary proline-rich protein 3-like [Sagmatias obliquidens]|uniref:basic salivary proline-rich protein 3-like n=1 Tax=Sagmatias obliquidens TaxID=3371155 RepID=UPI000F441EA1|nr:basic salivary proline-rich protein 3-like [Lagenorhynchus obliquidens]
MDRCPPWRCRPWPSAGGEEPLGPLRFRAEAGVGSRALRATAHSPRPTAAPALCSPPAWVPAWCSRTTPPSFSPSVWSLNPGLVPTGPAPQPSCRRWSLSALSLSTQKEARPSECALPLGLRGKPQGREESWRGGPDAASGGRGLSPSPEVGVRFQGPALRNGGLSTDPRPSPQQASAGPQVHSGNGPKHPSSWRGWGTPRPTGGCSALSALTAPPIPEPGCPQGPVYPQQVGLGGLAPSHQVGAETGEPRGGVETPLDTGLSPPLQSQDSHTLPSLPGPPPSPARPQDLSEPARHPATYRLPPTSMGRGSLGSRPSPATPAPAGGSQVEMGPPFTASAPHEEATFAELGRRRIFLNKRKMPRQEPTGPRRLPWQDESEPGEAGGGILEGRPRQACRLTCPLCSPTPPSARGTQVTPMAHSPGSEF